MKVRTLLTLLGIVLIALGTGGCAKRYKKVPELAIVDYKVKNNVKNFMEDYQDMQKTYYVRTVFQNNIAPDVEESFKKGFKAQMSRHGYKLVDNPFKATKVITLFPRITVNNSHKSFMIDMKIFGKIGMKKKVKTTKELPDGREYAPYVVVQNSNIVFFEDDFALNIRIIGKRQKNPQEFYDKAIKIVTDKIINVIGEK